MFLIGELADQVKGAKIINDLESHHIEAKLVLSHESGMFGIFVKQEDHIGKAQEIYRVNMGFSAPRELEEEWVKIKKLPLGFLTLIFLLINVAVFVATFLNREMVFGLLFFSTFKEETLFQNILQGEYWRLLTPAFVHMGFLHIIFNLMWFKDLGSVIEHKFQRGFFIVFILITAILSNVFQYLFMGPMFGGMSGVVYGMLGFLWVYRELDPSFDYGIPKKDIGFMLIWFFVCLFGIIPQVANLAHAFGLGAGMVLALLKAQSSIKLSKKMGIKYFFICLCILLATIFIEAFKLMIKTDQIYFLKF